MAPSTTPATRPPAIVLMGVAGCGKTSVGERLSALTGLVFRDADEFHPPANVDKMSAGIPLNDDDRWPWLDAIGQALHDADDGIIVTCSALKRAYRDRLRTAARRPVIFIHLSGSRDTIARRIGDRRGHFMPPGLLDSQFATLEPPTPDENALVISVESPLDVVVDAVVASLGDMIDTPAPGRQSQSGAR